MDNPVIHSMMNRKSVRKYTNQQPDDKVIEAVVRAGQQAPFVAQLYSILLNRKKKNPFGAPLLFTFCVDMHKLELIMARRGWQTVSNNLSLLFFGIQDAAYAAENMVIAAESLGMGSCFLGMTPYKATRVQKTYHLPKRVFPLVELVMGYPAEEFTPRPRYPLEYTLFEDRYPELTDDMVNDAMQSMDEGYLSQGYYLKQRAKIDIEVEGKEETYTYADYSWTEHISRKWGQWLADPCELLDQLAACGFAIDAPEEMKDA
jgi:FMN reductase (NADPH)